MARAKKAAEAATKIDPAIQAPSGQPWSYGLRTWNKDGSSRGDFKWDLTPEARTTAPDWRPTKDCGNGLHCNAWGAEDWTLMGDLSAVVSGEKVLGVVRFDPDGAIDLDGKHKAEWMEVVITTLTADLGTVLGFMAPKRHTYIQGLTKVQETAAATTGDRSAAATTGDRSAAATTGYSSAAATTGYRSAAATTGDRSAAATTGKDSIAAALGREGRAKAGPDGAIMLAAFGDWDGERYPLKAVFAGLVGTTHGDITIQPDTFYRLTVEGALEVAED